MEYKFDDAPLFEQLLVECAKLRLLVRTLKRERAEFVGRPLRAPSTLRNGGSLAASEAMGTDMRHQRDALQVSVNALRDELAHAQRERDAALKSSVGTTTERLTLESSLRVAQARAEAAEKESHELRVTHAIQSGEMAARMKRLDELAQGGYYRGQGEGESEGAGERVDERPKECGAGGHCPCKEWRQGYQGGAG